MTTQGTMQDPAPVTMDNMLHPFTTAERDALVSPAANLVIYNADENEMQAYVDGAWVNVPLPDCLAGAFVAPHEHEGGGHDHAGVYSETGHGHGTDYAAQTHGHGAAYAAKTHGHGTDYAAQNHDHEGTYAASTHNHDSRYARTTHGHGAAYAAHNHGHGGAYAAAGHNHNGVYAAKVHPHNYAASGHNHDSRYARSQHDHTQHIKAWGYVTGNGQLSGGNHGASVTRTGGNTSNFRYNVTLSTTLANPCIPIVTADVDRVRYLSKRTNGFEIQMEKGAALGTDSPFHFVVLGDGSYATAPSVAQSAYVAHVSFANGSINAPSNLSTRTENSSELRLSWNAGFTVSELRRYYIDSLGVLQYDDETPNRSGTCVVTFRVSRNNETIRYIELDFRMSNIVDSGSSTRYLFDSGAIHTSGFDADDQVAPALHMRSNGFTLPGGGLYYSTDPVHATHRATKVSSFSNAPSGLEYMVTANNSSADGWRFRIRPNHSFNGFRLVCQHIYNHSAPLTMNVGRLQVPFEGTSLSSFAGV